MTAAVPAEQLHQAVVHTVQNGQYRLGTSDDRELQATFSSGTAASSWGREFAVSVARDAAGSTLTLVCGHHDHAPKTWLDGWRNGQAARSFLRTLRSSLQD